MNLDRQRLAALDGFAIDVQRQRPVRLTTRADRTRRIVTPADALDGAGKQLGHRPEDSRPAPGLHQDRVQQAVVEPRLRAR